jgi:two-component system KDP operon response regulator KdpE
MTRILVVDDESRITQSLSLNLEARGFEVTVAATGHDALTAAASLHPDAVVLDLGLPDMSGHQVVVTLRERSDVPIVILSVRDAERDKVAALDAGADDYVTKPFSMNELVARLRAALRRRQPVGTASVVTTDHFTLDLDDRTAVVGGEPVRLTPTEWAILDALARQPGRLVTQDQVLKSVWPNGASDTSALRVHLTHLRRKLEPDPARPTYILTDAGVGYRFAVRARE